MRLTEEQFKQWEIVNKSQMQVVISKNRKSFYMTVSGPAANIPSVSNNRQLSVKTREAESLAFAIIKHPSKAQFLAKQLIEKLKTLRPTMRKNKKHVSRLNALTTLYDEATKIKIKLTASKKEPWAFFVYVGNLSNRTDSHNIPKALCDWFEDVGLIENDLYIDMGCYRSKHLTENGVDTLEVHGLPYKFAKEIIWESRKKVLQEILKQNDNIHPCQKRD